MKKFINSMLMFTVDIPAATCAALPPDASKYIDYSQSATFNSKSGRFGGRVEDGDYWQRVGLGPDRETRQMYHYFDVCILLASIAGCLVLLD